MNFVDLPQRHSIRLKSFDYSQAGGYFVTLVTHQRQCWLGEMTGETITLSMEGKIIQRTWQALPKHYPSLKLDAFCIMPNHVHGVLMILEDGQVALPEIIRGLKSFSAMQINALRRTTGKSFWQRNYYERVIRDEVELNQIRAYIMDNPRRWMEDKEKPENNRGGRGRSFSSG